MTRVVIFTVQIISDIQGRCDFQKTCSRFLTKFENNKKPILNNFDISHVRALDKKREIEKNSRLWKNLKSQNCEVYRNMFCRLRHLSSEIL